MLTTCLFILVNACEDKLDTFVVSETTPVTLSDLEITNIELDPVNINNPAVTFTWTFADYNQPASANYSIEIAADEAFTNSTVAIVINGKNKATLSIKELNSAARAVGLPPFTWNSLYARVISSLGTQSGLPVNSNSITFNVFPYFNYTFDDYYFVGNGTAPDWNNNANNPPLFRDSGNENLYYYTGYYKNDDGDFNNGRWKILETRGLWQPQWGVIENEGSDDPKESGEIAGNPGTQDTDPGRFGVTTSGYYEFTIDFAKKTYTTVPYDSSGADNYTSMSIQGTATPTIEMTQSDFDSHIWYLTSTRLVAGDLQFVTNTGSTWGSTTVFSGQASENGGKIPVVVLDDYEVWFNDLTGRYIMIPLNL
ncbi:SusE domain-containing protein [Tamlana sp. 2201CG12-4]|uniref:SusE domain-containing protein n=1 Tax=Tamlana sp. 2201CG12-4 TaxID=3112582 RepID=UPI002DBCE18D|nr:SusE domain-containing protein [Tamlana sp. 2201CG12-4]